MKNITVLFLFLLPLFAAAQAPTWQWSKAGIGTVYHDMAFGAATDGAGNGYVAGYFESSAAFDTITLTASGYRDMFLAKYNPQGQILWAVSGGGTGDDEANAVAVDVAGNAFVVGFFTGTATFDTVTLTSYGSGDWFVAKYDPQGQLLWARHGGSADGASDWASCVAVDGGGKCIVGGMVWDTATFGSHTLPTGGPGQSNIVLVRYDASGNEQWAGTYGGSSNDYISDVAVDDSASMYITGWYEASTCMIGTIGLSNSGQNDVLIAKINVSGTAQWAEHISGTNSEYGYGIAISAAHQVFVTGQFRGTVSFSSGTLTSNSGNSDIFTASYSSGGNLLWKRKAGSATGNDAGTGIDADSYGNAYISGYMFSGVFGSFAVNSAGDNDIVVGKYDASGTELWAKSAGGVSDDRGYAVATYGNDRVFISGYFADSAAFDTTYVTGPVLYDAFLARLGSLEPDGIVEKPVEHTSLFPNPSSGSFTIRSEKNFDAICVYDITGKIITRLTLADAASEQTMQLEPGCYIITIFKEDDVISRKQVIVVQ